VNRSNRQKPFCRLPTSGFDIRKSIEKADFGRKFEAVERRGSEAMGKFATIESGVLSGRFGRSEFAIDFGVAVDFGVGQPLGPHSAFLWAETAEARRLSFEYLHS
jgi:hypothetical protein